MDTMDDKIQTFFMLLHDSKSNCYKSISIIPLFRHDFVEGDFIRIRNRYEVVFYCNATFQQLYGVAFSGM